MNPADTKTMMDANSKAPNAAVFEGGLDLEVLPQALEHIAAGPENLFVVSDSARFLRSARANIRLTWAEIGLDRDGLSEADISNALGRWTEGKPTGLILVVDMGWVANHVKGKILIEEWGRISERIAADLGIGVVSRYHHDLLVEDQVHTALAAHRQFLAISGLYENPYWLPSALAKAPVSEQTSFLLGRVLPDYAEKRFFERDDRFAAHGADPDWLPRAKGRVVPQDENEIWRIHCFGQLRVYGSDGERIDWKTKGGAPKKSRALFAYLLTQGESGAHAEKIAELLWPDESDEQTKRRRLHHTIAMLRKTFGYSECVVRTGDFYRLNIPEGSWIDISSFEQLCRRGVTLFRRGNRDEALVLYRTAEKLYSGDLFQDISIRYIESAQEDWCLARRMWLREMALKLQRNMSALLREQGKLRAALEHCQKALALDPASDEANMETMRVYHAQGRIDTVGRQYRQYRKAMEMIDATPEGTEVQALFLALTGR